MSIHEEYCVPYTWPKLIYTVQGHCGTLQDIMFGAFGSNIFAVSSSMETLVIHDFALSPLLATLLNPQHPTLKVYLIKSA